MIMSFKNLYDFMDYYEELKKENKDLESQEYLSLIHAYDFEIKKFKEKVEDYLSVHVKRRNYIKAFVNHYSTIHLNEKKNPELVSFYHTFLNKILYNQYYEKQELDSLVTSIRDDLVVNNPEYVALFIEYSKIVNELNNLQTQYLNLSSYFNEFSNGELHEKIREFNESQENNRYLIFFCLLIITILLLILTLVRIGKRIPESNPVIIEEKGRDKTDRIIRADGHEIVEVISSIAFRIKSPLNGILGMTEILKSTELDNKQENYVDAIVDSGEKLQLIMNDAVDFLQLKNGEMGINESTLNPSKVLSSINNNFYPEFEKKGLNSILELDPSIPDNIKIDEKLFTRVLTNLYKNSLKFTLQGEILNKVEYKEIKNNLGEIHIHFSDTGVGIEKEHLDSIFQAKLKSRTSSKEYVNSETGLGLPITKMICEKMGGRIDVDSEAGKGTTFDIYLKCEVVEAPKNDDEGILKKTGALNILVAEDEKIIQKVIKTYLSSAGHNVDVANNGKKALEMTLEGSYDIIFMDMIMPEMDGVTSAQKINYTLKDNSPVIVALTANDSVEDRKRCRDAGMSDFLTKPVKKTKILDLLTRIFH